MIRVAVAAPDGPAEWLTAVGTLALAVATVIAVRVTVRMARTDRQRDDTRRQQDREREDQLRREADEKWEARRRAEQRRREDSDAQQQVIVGFLAGGPRSTPGSAVFDPADGITHRIIVTTTAAYPIKWLDARVAHRTSNSIGTLGTGWSFDRPVTENGQVRYTCNARVGSQVRDPAPVVRFTDSYGNLYYSYLDFTRRFSQNTAFHEAAVEIDEWVRTGPKPDEPAT